MSFTSLQFIAFLFIVGIFYFALPKAAKKYVLLVASLAFYYGFGLKAFVIMLATGLLTFFLTLIQSKVSNAVGKKALLAFTILLDAGTLVLLKYVADFREGFSLVVPIGISFYTLSIIGYAVDVYQGKVDAEKNPFLFLLYVGYFPHILQGPIARYGELKDQFKAPVISYENVAFGAQLMIWGYIKKLIIADRVAIFVDAVYSDTASQTGTALFLASIFYTVQIYMDFSGCVDIALGVSQIFGISLRPNFNQPYLANSINDFWRRWHMSLSSWFRDYVYIPLGGNRKGKVRRWINVLIVFTISGFWHGVGLNFVLWGLLHGVYQIIGAVLKPIRKILCEILHFNSESGAFHCLQVVITFMLVNEAWVLFRITDVKEALRVIKNSFLHPSPWIITDGTLNSYGVMNHQWHVVLFFLALTVVADILHEKGIHIRESIARQHIIIRWSIYFFGLFSILLFGVYGLGYDANSFIYMNF